MKWFNWLRGMRKRKDITSTLPDAETETMILPQSARTADISPLSLDKYTVRDFYAARGGERGGMSEAEYDYLLSEYLQATNPDGYGKMVVEYRAMLTARINLDKAYLVVTLPYKENRKYYAGLGLSSDMKKCRARIAELERKAKAAAEAYVKSMDAPAADEKKYWGEDMTREVAMLSKYLGFSIDPATTAIGVYIGYLRLMVEESRNKAKK